MRKRATTRARTPSQSRTPLRRTRGGVAALLAAALLLFEPAAGAVNRRQLREARERYARIQKELNRLAAEYGKQANRLDEIEDRIASTKRSLDRASAEMAQLQARLRQRVRTAYRLGGLGFFEFLLSSTSFREFSLRAMALQRQSSQDEDLVLRLRRLRAQMAHRQRVLRGQRKAQADILADLRRKAAELDAAFGTAKALLARLEDQRRAEELAAFFRTRPGESARGRVFALARCPAAGPHAFSNDWGAPRGGGRRRHQGNDIFAPMGSPAVAVVPGRISRHSTGGLGGLAVYLWGDDGNEYYYAHMSGFATPVGARVSAGQTIAYVGNTGNARGGAPHIHFEIHPGGGAAVNPYPSLIRVC